MGGACPPTTNPITSQPERRFGYLTGGGRGRGKASRHPNQTPKPRHRYAPRRRPRIGQFKAWWSVRGACGGRVRVDCGEGPPDKWKSLEEAVCREIDSGHDPPACLGLLLGLRPRIAHPSQLTHTQWCAVDRLRLVVRVSSSIPIEMEIDSRLCVSNQGACPAGVAGRFCSTTTMHPPG